MTSSWQALSICHPSAGDAALGRAQCRGTKYSHPQIPSNAGRMNEDFRPFFRADRRASSSRSTTRSKSFSLARRTICATRKAADQAPPLSIAPPLFDLAEGQSRMYHELRTGLRLEVIFQLGQEAKSTGKPPIVFIHGSYHAAWCWAVYWLPFFSNQGHDCYAISLPGHVGAAFLFSDLVADRCQDIEKSAIQASAGSWPGASNVRNFCERCLSHQPDDSRGREGVTRHQAR